MKRDVATVMSFLNVEDKYIDTGASTTLSGAWQLLLLNGVATGTTSVTRVGQSIKQTGWEFKWFLTIDPASTTVQSARIVVFFDTQPNAAAPTATDVYPATSASQRVVSYLNRFEIVYERWIILDPATPSGEMDIVSRGLEKHVAFNTGSAGTIADVTKNSFYMMLFSDAGASFPVLVWTSRVSFVDN